MNTLKDTIDELNEQSTRISSELLKDEEICTFTKKHEKKCKTFKNVDFSELLKEERAEYKCMNNGITCLNNVELISLIINNGKSSVKSLMQARQMLNIAGGHLKELEKKRTEEIEVIQGIGDGKAISIKAAIELGRRFYKEENLKNDLGSAEMIYNYMRPTLANIEHEEAHIILMNQNYKLIREECISSGGITETAVDIRQIMKSAVVNNTTVLALCHNHPSNNPSPSADDDRLTQRVKKACEIMRIYFLDHIIVTDGSFYSYREEGRI